MKRFFVLILAALMLVLAPCAAYADGNGYVFGFYEADAEEVAEFNLLAQEIYDDYGVAVCYLNEEGNEGKTLEEIVRTAYDEKVGEEYGLMLLDCLWADEYYIYLTPAIDAILTDADAETLCNTYEVGGVTYGESVIAYLNCAREIFARVLPEGVGSSAAADVPADSVKTPSGAYIPAERQLARVVDNAGVLTVDELAALNARADKVSEQFMCDVAVVLVAGTDGKDIKNFAFDFYDYNGYGYGDNDDGVMLVVDVEGRYFQCITHAFGAYAFTDAGQEYADDYYLPYLSDNDWNGAADAFITVAAQLLQAARNGEPIDVDNIPKEPMSPMWIVIDLIVGFVLALIPVRIMKNQLKSVGEKKSAASYVRRDSFRLDRSSDRFVRRYVTKVPRPKENSSSHSGGSGGGGTSFSTSSSGRSFGSHGGKF